MAQAREALVDELEEARQDPSSSGGSERGDETMDAVSLWFT